MPFLLLGCVVGLGVPQGPHEPIHRGTTEEPIWLPSLAALTLTLSHPCPAAAGLLCHISIVALFRKEPASPQLQGNPQQLLGGEQLPVWPLSQAEVASDPKQGVGSAGQPHAPSFLVSAGGPGPTPACTPELRQPGPEVPGEGGRGVANTHGLGRVLQTKLIRLPAACTRSQIPLPLVLFQYEHTLSCVRWLQGQGSLIGAFSLA